MADFRDNVSAARLLSEGEPFNEEDVRRGLLRLPDPPERRPEPPVEEQHEMWGRLDDLPRSSRLRRWVQERLERDGGQ